MRGRILRSLVEATLASFIALILATVPGPIGAFTNDPSTPSEEQKLTDQDRCKFLMENVNATILSLNTEGEITFLNQYGQRFFGYSGEEILGKPMLGTLTPLTGFQGRDLTTFMAGICSLINRASLHGRRIGNDAERRHFKP
jgi:PAS domain-containing protein